MAWREYREHLEENLRDLVARLKAKRYKPLPARRVYIPKDEHSQRPLGLPALEDKIVQKGMAFILEAIYEADFLDCSYLKAYFDSVSHPWLMKFLQVRIKDPSLLLLVQRFLKAGYMEAEQIVATERGTPQGGNLSPTLSNIFLHYVLDLWFEKRLKRQVRGVCFLVRYADDFVCLVQYQEDAQSITQALRERFAQFDLELHPEKTRTISFGRYERENARRQQRRPHTFDFLGFTHYCGQSRKGKFIVGRQTSRKKFRKRCQELKTWLKAVRSRLPVKEWWPVLKAKLRGHYQYYGVSGNMRGLTCFYRFTVRLVHKWLNRRSQRRTFYWLRFLAYLKHYPLPLPRIVHNLYTLSPAR